LKRWIHSKAGRWGIGVLLCLAALWLLLRYAPLPDDKLRGDFSNGYLAADNSLLHIELSESGKVRIPVRLEEVSPQLLRGLVAYEDKWFYRHGGVNPIALVRALALNLTHRRVVSGGSTLTLQLAKLLSPRRRTLGAKAVEMFRALQLEARYSKREILEAYLNTAPMGGNIEGVAAGSLLYFGKMPRDLSWGEAALLISLPRSPTYRRPDRRPDKAKEGRNRVLRRLAGERVLDARELKDAYDALIPTVRLANPDRCPHLTRRLGSAEARGFVQTTIHPTVQEVAERALRRASGGLKPLGVANGSLLVLDNRTMEALAYVGSPDFNEKRGGQVNGAAILRSPGSALKPFLYALALQIGRITPKDMVYDLPRDWSGFKPANFEGLPAGPLRAGDALAQSLNLPAVWLEASLRRENGGLSTWMKSTGFTTQGREHIDPGLSLVLGAYPMTLEEMASLYALLARGGILDAVRLSPTSLPLGGSDRRFLTPEACYLVSEMLAEVVRPDLPSSWEFSPDHAKIAFKTGTSFGYRDAWCCAYTPRYTVAVWLGNADASGSPALTGARAAAPVAFEVMKALTLTKDDWFQRPSTVSRRKVCRLTGRPLGPDCPSWEEDDYIVGVSQNERCPVHRRIHLRVRDGVEVCLRCMTGKASEYRSKVIEVWPPEIAGFLRARGKTFDVLPRHNPDCPHPPEKAPPRIASPDPMSRYLLTEELPKEAQRIPLLAQTSADASKVFWFVGGKPIGSARPNEALFWAPEKGWWALSVVDSEGRSASVTIHVEEKLAEAKP